MNNWKKILTISTMMASTALSSYAQSWGDVAFSGSLVNNHLCYTDGKDIICDGDIEVNGTHALDVTGTVSASGNGSILHSSANMNNAGVLIDDGSGNVLALDANELAQFNNELYLQGEGGINILVGDAADGTLVNAMHILTDGKVGVGTQLPSTEFEVSGTVTADYFVGDASGMTGLPSSPWTLNAGNVYRPSGHVGIGTTTPDRSLKIVGTGGVDDDLVIESNGNTAASGLVSQWRSRGTNAAPTAVLTNDALGSIDFRGHDGSSFRAAAGINAYATNDFATSADSKLSFYTSHAGTFAERMFLDNYGMLEVKHTGGAVQLIPNGGGIDITSSDDGFGSLDFKGAGNEATDYQGRIGYLDGTGFTMLTDAGPGSLRFDGNQIRLDTPTLDVALDHSYGMKLDINGFSGGGWARGFNVVEDTSRTAGAGFLGSNTSVNSYHIGIGSEWWNADSMLAILSDGKVGVGTKTPATELEVSGTITADYFVGDASGLTGLPSSPWSVSTTDVYRAGGNVGIGTDSPTIDLQLGDGTGDETMLFARDDVSQNLDVYSSYDGKDDINDQTGMFAYGSHSLSDSWGVWHKGTATAAPGWENYLEITKDGLMGVGTGANVGGVSPTARLHVFDDSDATAGDVLKRFHVGNGTEGLYIGNGTASGFTPFITAITEDDNDILGITNNVPTAADTGNYPAVSITPRSYNVGTGAATQLTNRDIFDVANYTTSIIRVTADGKVGINDTTPSYELDVSGSIMASQSSGVTNPNNTDAVAFLQFIDDVPTLRYGGSGVGAQNGFRVTGTSDVVKMEVSDAGVVSATAFIGDGSGLTGLASSPWTLDGSDVYRTVGNVGIGTADPSQTIHIANDGEWGNRAIRIDASSATGFAEAQFAADAREFRIGTGGSGTNAEFANNFYIYDRTADAARVSINPNGLMALTGVGGELLRLSTTDTGVDHAYMTFFADADNPAVRSGWMGYGNGGTVDMHIRNELSGGDVIIDPVSNLGQVLLDGQTVVDGVGAGDENLLTISAPEISGRTAIVVDDISLSTGMGDGKAFAIVAGGMPHATNVIYTDGKYAIGPGTNVRDVVLSRHDTNVMKISSDGVSGAADLLVTRDILASRICDETGANCSDISAGLGGGGGGSINDLSDAKHDTDDFSSLFLGNGAGASDDGTNNKNVGIGKSALTDTTNGQQNAAVGYQALFGNTTGSYNSAYGHQSMWTNRTGQENSAFGVDSLRINFDGDNNTAMGRSAMYANSSGNDNVAVGYLAFYTNNDGSQNTAVGSRAGYGDFGGGSLNNNTFVGYSSGLAAIAGADNNTFLGHTSGSTTTTGDRNIMIGHGVIASAPTASDELNIGNTIYGDLANDFVGIGIQTPTSELDVSGTVTADAFVGDGSGLTGVASSINDLADAKHDTDDFSSLFLGNGAGANDDGTNNNNLGIGKNALTNTTDGINNVALSGSALLANTSGNSNIAVGSFAMAANTTGNSNTSIGIASLRNNKTGSRNVALGGMAGNGSPSNSDYSYSTLVGYQAGGDLQTGADYNTMIGYLAGDDTTTGSGNIMIGNNVQASTITASNELNIGNTIYGDLASGYVGIGTNTPTVGLHMIGDGAYGDDVRLAAFNTANPTWSAGLQFTRARGTEATPASVQAGDYLGVINFAGSNGAADVTAGRIHVEATSAFSGTPSSFMSFLINDGTSAIESMRISDDRSVWIDTLCDETGANCNDLSAGLGGGGGGGAINDLSDAKYDGSSLFLGNGAGTVDDGTANSNVGVGRDALKANTTGGSNVAVGYQSLDANVDGNSNTAIGRWALSANTSADNNVAVGSLALFSNSTGSSNTAVGTGALRDATSQGNTSVGYQAAYDIASGTYNTAMGFTSLFYNRSGHYNVSLGAGAGTGAIGNSDVSYNVFIGSNAGYAVQTGADRNVFIGQSAGDATTTGSRNILIGNDVDASAPTASNELNIGNIIKGNMATWTTDISGTLNVAQLCDETGANCNDLSAGLGGGGGGAGAVSLSDLTDAFQDASAWPDLYLGTGAGANAGGGNSNIGIGYNALSTQSGDSDSIAIGWNALASADGGYSSIAIGSSALRNNTWGYENIAIGEQALSLNTEGYNNVAIGSYASANATTGNANTGVGAYALGDATTSSNNSAFGEFALGAILTGAGNTAVGKGAIARGRTNAFNVALGMDAGRGGAIGASNFNHNTLLGYKTGYLLGDGANNNIMIGYQAGDATTSGTGNILIGYDVDASGASASDELNIGNIIKGDLSTSQVWINTLCDETGANCNDLSAGLGGGGAGAVSLSDLTDAKVYGTSYYIGQNAGNDVDNTFYGNVGIGRNALYNGTSALKNIAIGDMALNGLTTGRQNVAIGSNVLNDAVTGSDNIAIGNSALASAGDNDENVAIGSGAGGGNSSAGSILESTLVGYDAGSSGTGNALTINRSTMLGHTVGGGNTGDKTFVDVIAIGTDAAYPGTANTLESRRTVAIGNNVLGSNGTVNNSVVIGHNAGSSLIANNNTFIGYQAGDATIDGTGNILIGSNVDASGSSASNELNIGNIIKGNMATWTTDISGTLNVAQLCDETGANCNDLSAGLGGGGGGAVSLTDLTDAVADTHSVYVGSGAGVADNLAGNRNTGVGVKSLNANVNGNFNAAYGYQSMEANVSGGFNTAIGVYAMEYNTSGSSNTALGYAALNENTTGGHNVVLGREAMFQNVSGASNVALGYQAGKGVAASSNVNNNVFVGTDAGRDVLTGANNNVMVGYSTGSATTTGARNILIGSGVDASGASASDELNIGNIIKGDMAAWTTDISGTLNVAQLCDETGANCNDLSAGLGGGGATPSGQMAAGFPDAVMCDVTGWGESVFYLIHNGSAGGDVTYRMQSASNTYDIDYNTSGTFLRKSTSTPNNDCNDNAWNISDMYTQGRAFNFTGEDVSVTTPAIWDDTTDTDGISYANSVAIGKTAIDPTLALDISGSIEYTGTLTDISDRRLKQNVQPLESGQIDRIAKVEAVSFEMKNNPGVTELGVIAQDFEAVFPELVKTSKDASETKSVNYMGLIAPMLKAMQEMKAELDVLKAENAEQKAQIEALMAK